MTRSLACTVVVAAALIGAFAARAAGRERFAVLPVDADRDGDPLAVQAAAAARQALVAQALDVVTLEKTRRYIVDRLKRGGIDISSYRTRFEQAEAALAVLDQDGSLQILELLLGDLAADPEFTTEKQALLERTRLQVASRLVGLAGAKESGKGETAYGKRARGILVDALRANPAMAPSKDEYPPRLLALLEGARAELSSTPTGTLSVNSRPQGAQVLVEGRVVGATPILLPFDSPDALKHGKYRVWVEADGGRSVPQLVTITDRPTPVFVDLAFEGALWAEGPGLRPLAGNSIDEEVAKTIGRFLDVDTLLLLGTASYDAAGAAGSSTGSSTGSSAGSSAGSSGGGAAGDSASNEWLWGAAFTVADGTTARRGAVRLSADVGIDAAAATLAKFLGRGEREGTTGVEDRPLPPSILPSSSGAGALASNGAGNNGNGTGNGTGGGGGGGGGSEGGQLPWLEIGLVGGGVVVVGAILTGVVAALALQQPEGAVVIAVTERFP